MYSFRNDYSEGAHPKVLQRLIDTNLEQTCGYALDPLSDAARETVRRVCAAPEADVHFISGGTQTNLLTIAAFLRPYEAVIAPYTAHISLHEAGAIEATGHKVCAVETPDGKLTAEMVASVADGHTDEFMVRPRMVYISDSTELGTIYTKAELTALRRCCDERGLYLFLDGARLGSALTAPGNDLTLPDLAALTDAFYIGGTKNGALFGEALVLKQPLERFRWHMKQRGAILAKGRTMALQFQALLEDGTYLCLYLDDCAFLFGEPEELYTGVLRSTDAPEEARMLHAMEAAGYDLDTSFILDMYRHGKVNQFADIAMRAGIWFAGAFIAALIHISITDRKKQPTQ